LDDLIKLYKEIKKVQTNKNKEIVIFCNQLVIDDLEWLRDDDNNLIFDIKESCPITGCQTVCRAKMKLQAVDDLTIPVNALGQTDIYGACVDNIYFTSSKAEIKERKWDTMLNDMNDRIIALNYRTSGIPAIFPNSVKKITRTV
ncbi:MAG: hypothetical protein ACRCZ2_10025, partial [Fusobacteriaceae bacterium]